MQKYLDGEQEYELVQKLKAGKKPWDSKTEWKNLRTSIAACAMDLYRTVRQELEGTSLIVSPYVDSIGWVVKSADTVLEFRNIHGEDSVGDYVCYSRFDIISQRSLWNQYADWHDSQHKEVSIWIAAPLEDCHNLELYLMRPSAVQLLKLSHCGVRRVLGDCLRLS